MMMMVFLIIWLLVILALVLVAVFFLRGAAAVEYDDPGDERCICKRSRFTVWANINCPVHGEKG